MNLTLSGCSYYVNDGLPLNIRRTFGVGGRAENLLLQIGKEKYYLQRISSQDSILSLGKNLKTNWNLKSYISLEPHMRKSNV